MCSFQACLCQFHFLLTFLSDCSLLGPFILGFWIPLKQEMALYAFLADIYLPFREERGR